jgi:tetratricopeptide (TPR) repeat protein
MNSLAESYHLVGRAAEALRLREETLKMRTVKLGPEHADTLKTKAGLADSYAAAGRNQEAMQLYEDALRRQQAQFGADHPVTLAISNNFAWFLATVSDVALRNAKRAVELAAFASAKAPKEADYRATLGVARYRDGDWNRALAESEQSIALRKSEDPKNTTAGLIIAMAKWRLGDKNRARAWYDKSLAWMEKGEQDKTDLKRLCAEAAELLAANDQTDAPKERRTEQATKK